MVPEPPAVPDAGTQDGPALPGERVRKLARLLDAWLRIPGTRIRIGLDALLGLLPVGGDVVGALLSAWIVLWAARLGAPPSVLVRMTWNLVADALVGALPVVGDLLDVGWKANLRNLRLLERHLDEPGRAARRSRWTLGAVGVGLVAILSALTWGAWMLLRAALGWIFGV